MKSSDSSLDQTRVSAIKRCPLNLATLNRIISHWWSHQKVPKCWKLGSVILIYGKDSPENPDNFNPLKLELICAKAFSSLIRSRTSTFLVENNYIETNIPKRFSSGVFRKVEHTEILTYLIHHARRYHRNLTVTLLDLRNVAFGEVEHDFIQAVLSYHKNICNLIAELYKDYQIAIGTSNYIKSPVKVKKG